MNLSRFLALAAAVALTQWCAAGSFAQEHPEHPEQPADKEHPEHPEGDTEVTLEMLGDAIEQYVAWDAKMHGGFLFLHDSKTDETLALTLDKVHRERLSSLGHGVYFACADFQATNGHVYDIDVFMEATEGSPFEGLAATEIAVHKVDGKARYSWYEKDGVWKKKQR